MCNLYSMTTTTEAIQRLVAEWEDAMRNVPPLHAIYPELHIAHSQAKTRQTDPWIRPLGAAVAEGPSDRKPNRGNTNIRNPLFDDWRGYLGIEHRCWSR